jgi:hypothetical protein
LFMVCGSFIRSSKLIAVGFRLLPLGCICLQLAA